MTSEEKIIELLKTNYKDGFSLLFSFFYHSLCRVAAKYVSRDAACDIVHDVFLNIWNTHFIPKDIFSMKAYLYNAVYNKCLNEIRKNKNSDKYRNTISLELFQETIFEEDIFNQLLEAINRLPEHYRIAMELSLNGVSLDEIAKKMNTSIDAVKAHKRRAKILLKRDLGKLYFMFFC